MGALKMVAFLGKYYFLLLLCFFMTFANAKNFKPLSGSFLLRGASITDPASDESQNTHMAFFVKGIAAKQIYQAMKADAKTDECHQNGTLVKSVGEMQCMKYPEKDQYECAFSIEINQQKIEGAWIC